MVLYQSSLGTKLCIWLFYFILFFLSRTGVHGLQSLNVVFIRALWLWRNKIEILREASAASQSGKTNSY